MAHESLRGTGLDFRECVSNLCFCFDKQQEDAHLYQRGAEATDIWEVQLPELPLSSVTVMYVGDKFLISAMQVILRNATVI